MNNPFAQSTFFAGQKVHLGISGSVACYKACDLLRELQRLKLQVSATLSAGARHFITPLLLEALGAVPVYGEMFSGERALEHLEPGEQAKVMAIAPASANMLAKFAQGRADDMLSAQFLAFSGPRVIAPAMNPRMWASRATKDNAEKLREFGCTIVEPALGTTACGEVGQGRLAPLEEITFAILESLCPKQYALRNVLVTLGPTREPWDGVRFWSNPSSGRMGAALATAAWLMGADVTAICGPGIQLVLPKAVEIIRVETAKDMYEASQDVWPRMDIGIFTAAVADFAPVPPACGSGKFKKDKLAGDSLNVEFSRSPDILATLSKGKKSEQKILGFAAEITENLAELLPLARAKLRRKGADLLAANMVNGPDSAFCSDAVALAVVDKNGEEQIWDLQSKSDAAWGLLSWLLRV